MPNIIQKIDHRLRAYAATLQYGWEFRQDSMAAHKARGYYRTTIAGEEFKCDPYHIQDWKDASEGKWEPETYRVLSEFVKPGSVYYDIGAWIGPTVIYAARTAKRVVCFEPDPSAYRFLLWNIHLNELKNVSPFNLALTDSDGIRPMASFGGSPGDSMTSLLKTDAADGFSALCMSWPAWRKISQEEKIDFIKMDIEGGEFLLLPAMEEYLTKHKPVLYLSTHAPYLDPQERLQQMQRIKQVVQIYGKCINERLEEVSIEELFSSPALNEFQAYLFTD